MDMVLVILIIVIGMAWLLGLSRPAPQPHIIVIQSEAPVASASGGCLTWIVTGFIILLVLGLVQ